MEGSTNATGPRPVAFVDVLCFCVSTSKTRPPIGAVDVTARLATEPDYGFFGSTISYCLGTTTTMDLSVSFLGGFGGPTNV
jgi:hypothetical protein